jgi:hypothetical protein
MVRGRQVVLEVSDHGVPIGCNRATAIDYATFLD